MKLPFNFEFPASPWWRYGLSAAAILIIGGYFFFGRGGGAGVTFTITPGDFREQVSVSGTVTAAQNVALGFAASGRIVGTYAKVGQRVGAGTVLAETDNGDLAATLEQKKAALASLLAGARSEEVAVAQTTLVNAIQSAYTAADDAVHNRTDSFFSNPRVDPKFIPSVTSSALREVVERDRVATEPALLGLASLVAQLTSDNAAISAPQVQKYLVQVMVLLADANTALNQSVSDQTTSAATLASYATTLATARTNVSTAVTALSSAQAALTLKQSGPTVEDIAAAQAAVDNARAVLAKTRVVAPFAGIVTRMDAKVGEIVSPTDSQISMQSDGIFQIETYVPEVTIAGVAPGNPATTTLDAYGSSVTFASVVISVDPAETVKDGVPTYKTMLAFRKADSRIRSGMTANVVMETGMLRDAIVIPSGAIGTKDGVRYVSVVEDGAVIMRAVTTGPSPALGQAQILSGLAKGDVILLSPEP
jgi:RND family efflux transporter MFP subunit